MSKERDWPANLGTSSQLDRPLRMPLIINLVYSTGMMDWDNTSIVFTKRSLIEFLKYAAEHPCILPSLPLSAFR